MIKFVNEDFAEKIADYYDANRNDEDRLDTLFDKYHMDSQEDIDVAIRKLDYDDQKKLYNAVFNGEQSVSIDEVEQMIYETLKDSGEVSRVSTFSDNGGYAANVKGVNFTVGNNEFQLQIYKK
jgi:hypothetical protein